MALDTRLIGKALGLADPIDIGRALEPAIQKGERRFAEERARQEREQVRARQEQIRQEENTAKAISLMSNINEAGVAPNLRSYISKNVISQKKTTTIFFAKPLVAFCKSIDGENILTRKK